MARKRTICRLSPERICSLDNQSVQNQLGESNTYTCLPNTATAKGLARQHKNGYLAIIARALSPKSVLYFVMVGLKVARALRFLQQASIHPRLE